MLTKSPNQYRAQLLRVGLILAALLIGAPSRAQVGKQGDAHDHSTATRGGATIAPVQLSMLAGSTMTVLGAGYVSSLTVTNAFIVGTSTYTRPVSSFTAVPQQTTTQTTYVIAFATVTINASGRLNVRACYFGQCNQATTGQKINFNVKEDGNFVSPYDNTTYTYAFQSSNASYNFLASWCVILRAPSAGVHVYTLQAKVTASTGGLGQTDGGLATFGVEEIASP